MESNMKINIGDLVRFKLGLYPEEYGLMYLVTEVNGDRCIIKDVNENHSIRSSRIAKVEELHVYMESSELKDFIENSDNY